GNAASCSAVSPSADTAVPNHFGPHPTDWIMSTTLWNRACPMYQPRIPPSTEATVHKNPYHSARLRLPSASAISNGSGGIGKKLASVNESSTSAGPPYLVSAK